VLYYFLHYLYLFKSIELLRFLRRFYWATMKICFMKLRDAVRLIALFGMVVSVICFGIGIKVAKNYKSQEVKEVAQAVEVSVTENLSTSTSASHVDSSPEENENDPGSSNSDKGDAEEDSDTTEGYDYELIPSNTTELVDRSRRDVRREARGDTFGEPMESKDVDNETVSGNDQILTQNSSLPALPSVEEISKMENSEDEGLVTEAQTSTASSVEPLLTTTPEPDASASLKAPSNDVNEDDVETSGSSEVTSPREVVFTDADDEITTKETEAINFDKSSEGKVENVVDETTLPSSAKEPNIKGESAASTDDDSSGEISNHVYVAGLFSIFLFLIGFGANILLLEAVRKEKSVLLPFWMVWCGFAILYMFSGLVISGVEAKYGHLVLFMMLLALFSYFQAVVYNYRSELIKKYDVKPVEMNRLDKRYGGLDLLNVSGEGDSKV